MRTTILSLFIKPLDLISKSFGVKQVKFALFINQNNVKMKKSIQTKHELQASIKNVWSLIRSGANWEDWFPILTGSRVEGTNRYCDLDNGDILEEKFLASEAENTFIYNVHKQNSFPANNIVAIMRLEELNAEKTGLTWSVDFDVETEGAYVEIKGHIEQIYKTAASELTKLATSIMV